MKSTSLAEEESLRRSALQLSYSRENQPATLVDIQIAPPHGGSAGKLAREPIGLLSMGHFVSSVLCPVKYFIYDKSNGLSDIQSAARKIIDDNPNPHGIGISTYTYNYPLARLLARAIKEADPTVRIAFGGPHAGMIPEEVYDENRGVVDAVIAGEGENGFIDFLQGIDGVISRQPLSINLFHRADRIESLLENPHFPPIGGKPCRAAAVETSRGCTRSCDFCITRLTRYRSKLEHLVKKEINSLVKEYDVDTIIFDDPLLNGDLSHLDRLTAMLIRERESGGFGRELRFIGMCDFNLGEDYLGRLEQMSRAGFTLINWGIEDPRPAYRCSLNKKIPVQEKVLQAAHNCGIRNRGLLMLPTNLEAPDPHADIKSYAEALSRLALDEISVNVLTPFPGTPLYNHLNLAGRMEDGRGWTKPTRQEPAGTLKGQDWSLYDTNHLVFRAGRWTQEVVDWGRAYLLSTFASGSPSRGTSWRETP